MNRLKKLRLERGVSQADVGKLFKITRQAVQRWEVGKSHPNIYQLIALAKYFDVDPEYLVGWVDE
ncbi:helix-turn-helix domain-containing protein [Leuconostoc mesenteroides]|uniref:helix-turn-helix domain-containing protein n=1 Tax=Leuconostoc mesenteroides TaxID=1245 RepID=UPI00235F2B7A|nr:helix-turn-helix transcriptional regulator [Leuconostoc mesenteroides]